MPEPNEPSGPRPLGNVGEVVAFLQSLWGILAAVTLVFPLSNKLLPAIPLAKREGTGVGLVIFDPALPATMATFVSVFLLFLCVSSRRGVEAVPAIYVRILASVVFALGLILLVSYLYLYSIYDGTYRSIMREISVTVLFAGFSGCATAAFTLLGLKEYASAAGSRFADKKSS